MTILARDNTEMERMTKHHNDAKKLRCVIHFKAEMLTWAIVLLIPAAYALHHQPHLVVRRGQSAFSCSFMQDTCGMTNQEPAKAKWHRKYVVLGGQSGPAMVVNGNEADNHFARFLTPTIQTQDLSEGCLRFRYYIAGTSAASLSVIKQGYVTQYVFATAHRTRNRWAQAEINVPLLGDEVMFYFEADTKVQEYGESMVAFTEVNFDLVSCTAATRHRRT